MKVIYSTEQNAAFDRQVGFSSPSASKPEKVIADWKEHGIPMEIIPSIKLSEEQIATAHNPKFVSDILNGRINNGFGNRSMEVAASLPYTNGAMVRAARIALSEGESVCAPVSGFHHAGFNSAEGFCTFNGLAIAALGLHNLAHRIAILDCDQHYGNGTVEILRKKSVSERFHGISHATAGEHFGSDPDESGKFFDWLRSQLKRFEIGNSKLVIYQAGADPHINDPLGGFLTTEQLAKRDQIVFDWSRRTGIPIAWNLAGGYQESEDGDISPVLEIHRNTVLACIG